MSATKKTPSEDPMARLREDFRKRARVQLYIASGTVLVMMLYPWLFL